ncbi:class I SAM-dependent methyltransferase [Streptomyces sp. NPDC006660]|uniref:class I SAM-dependent methyltransferase n=1 Tax=Streptomyces sp. NPDC006660 TaxID=3156901 RepID=UPI00340BD898
MDRTVRTVEDVLTLLDGLFASEPGAGRLATGDGEDFWDGFYADRSRPVPFFVAKPDEHLAGHLDRGVIPACGRALDLGCGPGRNALHLAARGFEVDAVDLSPVAVAWAGDRAREAGLDIRFHRGDAFALPGLDGPYDLIVDSGCFHHLAPHRRVTYLAFLDRVLAPGGHLALTSFAAGEQGMGCELTDEELYRAGALGGGLAYTPEALRWIFSDLSEVEVRRMREQDSGSPHFGRGFLWAALFRRETPAGTRVTRW